MKTILKVLVGSQAHGLAGPESDQDWRGVFAIPTSDILSLNSTKTKTIWLHDQENREVPDDTAHEVGHFLFLATKCNPTILEVFVGKTYEADYWGEELRALFPHIWNSRGVRDAFVGYGKNQQKKFLADSEVRPAKYATAYVRSLFGAWQLLTTGWFDLDIRNTEIEPVCRKFRAGNYTKGEVIDTCALWEERVRAAYEKNPDKQTDLRPVNDYLLRIRKAYWA